MPTIEINGKNVEVNEEGFLLDPTQWDEAVAEAIAEKEQIALTDRHWDVIRFCRKDFEATGKPPGVRRITKVGGIPTKEMYSLFPGGPGKLAAKLAGLSKPTGCV